MQWFLVGLHAVVLALLNFMPVMGFPISSGLKVLAIARYMHHIYFLPRQPGTFHPYRRLQHLITLPRRRSR